MPKWGRVWNAIHHRVSLHQQIVIRLHDGNDKAIPVFCKYPEAETNSCWSDAGTGMSQMEDTFLAIQAENECCENGETTIPRFGKTWSLPFG